MKRVIKNVVRLCVAGVRLYCLSRNVLAATQKEKKYLVKDGTPASGTIRRENSHQSGTVECV